MQASTSNDHDTTPAPLLDTEQAAKILGIAKRTLENRRVSGIDSIPFCKMGRSVRYEPSAIREYLNGRRVNSTSEAGRRTAA